MWAIKGSFGWRIRREGWSDKIEATAASTVMRTTEHHDARLSIVRTTITLAADVAAAAEQLQRERGLGISDAINELVRRGLLAEKKPSRFRQESSDMGSAKLPLDDIAGRERPALRPQSRRTPA
jgi:hypothetical protein